VYDIDQKDNNNSDKLLGGWQKKMMNIDLDPIKVNYSSRELNGARWRTHTEPVSCREHGTSESSSGKGQTAR